MIYPFRMTRRSTTRTGQPTRSAASSGTARRRPGRRRITSSARDIAGVDTTLLLGVYPEGDLLLGLDPALYDPLPLGISVYAKDEHADEVAPETAGRYGSGRTARERAGGPARGRGPGDAGRVPARDRLLDYARFERDASDLGLDPPLRYAAAVDAAAAMASGPGGTAAGTALEESFDLIAQEILDIIHSRMRLEVAVKGGVAEYHLERLLRADPAVATVERLDQDAQPDFESRMSDGRRSCVECKNASPERYANGDYKVEVQKTRATQRRPGRTAVPARAVRRRRRVPVLADPQLGLPVHPLVSRWNGTRSTQTGSRRRTGSTTDGRPLCWPR